jgi:hypothetical protein
MRKTLTRDVPWTYSDLERDQNMDFLVKLYRMEHAIVFKLSNEVLQVRSLRLKLFHPHTAACTDSTRTIKQFNFYDHTKILLSHSGSIITFIDAEFNLTVYTLYSLFREASRTGFYRTTAKEGGDPKRMKRLEKVKFLIEKVSYCRDVLKELSSRKIPSVNNTVAGEKVV